MERHTTRINGTLFRLHHLQHEELVHMREYAEARAQSAMLDISQINLELARRVDAEEPASHLGQLSLEYVDLPETNRIYAAGSEE